MTTPDAILIRFPGVAGDDLADDRPTSADSGAGAVDEDVDWLTATVVVQARRPHEGQAPTILFADAALQAVTGHRPHDVIGRTPFALVSAACDASDLVALRDALDGARPARLELPFRCADGGRVRVTIETSAIGDDDGVPALVAVRIARQSTGLVVLP